MNGWKAKLVVLLAALLVGSAVLAQDQSITEDDVRAIVEESVNKAVSEKQGLLSRVEIHGFLSQGFLITDENNYHAKTKDGSFEFNEFGINFSTNFTPKLRAGLQLFARDLGPMGNDKITLDWANIDYRMQDWLGFRVGRIRVIEGLYNQTRDLDMLRTQVFLPESVYAELYRDVFAVTTGVSLYGVIPLGKVGDLSYEAQYGKLDTDADSGYARVTEVALGGYDRLVAAHDMDSDSCFTYGLRWQTPLQGLRLGWSQRNLNGARVVMTSSGMIFPASFDYVFDTFDGYVASAEFVWKNLTLASELRRTSYTTHINVTPVADATNEGYYVSGSYRFSDLFSAGYYYSVYYPDASNKDGMSGTSLNPDFYSWTKAHVVSTRFDLKPHWLFKLEAHIVDGWGVYTFAENDHVERKWMMFAAKMTVNF